MGESREPARSTPTSPHESRVASDLSKSENRYRSLINAATQILWTADAEGRVTEDSQSWRRVTGQTLEEFLGEGWIKAVHPDDQAAIARDWAAAVSESALLESEYRLRTASGSYAHMLVRAAPVWEGDQIDGWVGLNIDITELRNAERERDELALRVERNERSQSIANDAAACFASALTVEDVFRECISQLPHLMEVSGILILHRRTPGSAGQIWATPTVPGSLGGQWRLAPKDANFPAAEVLRSEEGVSSSIEGVGAVDSVPLFVDGRVVGALSIVHGQVSRRSGDRELIAQVANVISQAIGRVRRFERERSIAADLQRSMLPQELPELDGIDLGAAYRAGSTEADVGGDWFELLPLEDGSLLLAVGDVMGKGLAAAHTMVEFRQALRSLSILSNQPAQLMDLLAHFHQSRASDPNQLVTLVVGRFDPPVRELTWASAGHLPPLLQRVNGAPEYLNSQGLPLGIGEQWDEQCVKLGTGDIITFFSDGLVEGRSRPLGEGMALLEKEMTGIGLEGSAAICDKLIDSLAPGRDREDDATVLVLKVLGSGAVGRWPLLRTASSVKAARVLVMDELGRLGVDDPEVVEVIELLTSEVVTNAVLHGEGSVELDVTRIDRFIRISVSDEAVRLDLGPAPVNVEASTGRGLLLVESLATSWGVDELPSGKRVWFEMQVTPDA